MNETTKLAYEVLAVLDKQREYFKSRDQRVLVESKRMDKELREKCVRLIAQGVPTV